MSDGCADLVFEGAKCYAQNFTALFGNLLFKFNPKSKLTAGGAIIEQALATLPPID